MNTLAHGGNVCAVGAGALAPAPQHVRKPDLYAGHPVIAIRFKEGERAGKWCRIFYGRAGNPLQAIGTDDFRAVLSVGIRSKSEARRAVRTLRKLGEIKRPEKMEVVQRFRRVDGPGFEWVPV